VSGHIGRAFVAVVPPTSVLDAIARVVVATGSPPPGWRWIPREQWHLTLQFLGRVDDAEAVAAALQHAAKSQVAFAASLGGGGAFPSARRAGVVWAGVTDGSDVFTELAARVALALEPLGYEPDAGRFHPHLTVARARGKERRDGRVLVETLGAAPPGERFGVEEVVLFESRTRPAGAEYVVRARCPLAGAKRGERGEDA
jgi:2'-5' RNA ligase